MMRMRIAILHYSKPPVIGGVERVIGKRLSRSPLPTPFLHPLRPIEKHRHILPHWHQDCVWCFITWRLVDSLPQEFIQSWMNERDAWLRDHPKPWEPDVEAEYHQRFSERYLDLLDQGLGSCLLRQKACADAVEQALQFFNGTRYTLKSYVVMPNHVHVLVRLHDGWPLERLVQNWKERSAKAINAALGSTGTVWQKGYFDRLIRSAPHWEFVDGYIRHNPEKAHLKNGFRVWSADESSAYKLGEATSRRPSIVIVHNVSTMPFDLEWTCELLELSRTRPDIRWINWVHDVRWSEQVPQAVHVAVSEHRRQEYARVTQEPIHVIPNGVDAAAVLGLTERVSALKLENSGLVLLQPTRFVRRKNIELGLRVLAELPEAVYVVTAAPDPHQSDGVVYFAELVALSEALGVRDRVLFLGESGILSDDDVRGLYQMTDALFFPSTQEGYGLPLIEAALHGVPVLCSDIPAHLEVAVGATFFSLDEPAGQIAAKIRENAAVQARQERRALMWRLSWERIVRERLEPLLLGESTP
jgi:glycosyltransferase involved in cell wall biosynthesis